MREETFHIVGKGGALRENVQTHHTHTRAVGSAVISLTLHYSPALCVRACMHVRVCVRACVRERKGGKERGVHSKECD